MLDPYPFDWNPWVNCPSAAPRKVTEIVYGPDPEAGAAETNEVRRASPAEMVKAFIVV